MFSWREEGREREGRAFLHLNITQTGGSHSQILVVLTSSYRLIQTVSSSHTTKETGEMSRRRSMWYRSHTTPKTHGVLLVWDCKTASGIKEPGTITSSLPPPTPLATPLAARITMDPCPAKTHHLPLRLQSGIGLGIDTCCGSIIDLRWHILLSMCKIGFVYTFHHQWCLTAVIFASL
jgi:hypothetical protein